MKRFISIFLSLAMVLSICTGIDIAAFAQSEAVSLGEQKTITAYSNGDSRNQSFTFDCTQTDYYYFNLLGNVDSSSIYIDVTDSEGNEVTSLMLNDYDSYDESYSGNSVYLNLTAGTSYIFKFYTDSTEGLTHRFMLDLSPVTALSIVQESPLEIYENTSGYTDTDSNNESYYYYNYDPIDALSQITVTYRDKGEVVYKSTGSGFLTDDGERLNDYSYSEPQWQGDNHWTVGNTYTCNICYYGLTAPFKISIIENPFASIDCTPETPFSFTENCNGSFSTGNDGEYFDYYDYQLSLENSTLTAVLKKDGSSLVYEYDPDYTDSNGRYAYVLKDSSGKVVDTAAFERVANQYVKHWTVGKDNFITLKFKTGKLKGIDVEVPVEIKENPIASIVFETTLPSELTDGIDIVAKQSDDDLSYCTSVKDFYLNDKKAKLTVNKKTGESDVYTYFTDENYNSYFVNSSGDKIEYGDLDIHTDNDPEYPDSFNVGKNTVTVSLFGREYKFDVTVKQNPVSSISYKSAKGVSFNEDDGMLSFRYNFDTGEDVPYMCYNINSSTVCNVGDTLTVNFSDSSLSPKVYTCEKYKDKDNNEAYRFVSGNDVITDYTVSSNQDTGKTVSEAYFTYSGKTATIPVKIIPTDVESIELVPASNTATRIFDGEDYYYSENEFLKNAKLKVSYKNGSTVQFDSVEKDSSCFKHGDDYLYLYSDWSNYAWHEGESYNVSFYYIDRIKCTVTVKAGDLCDHSQTIVKNALPATCSKAGYTGDTYCKKCQKLLSKGKAIAKLAHKNKTYVTKATNSKDGQSYYKCTVCGAVSNKKAIYKASYIKLSKTSFTYSGKAQRPSVVVKNSKGTVLKNGRDYSVSYSSGCKKVGVYTVKITFKGNYSGTKSYTFYITPKNTSLSKVTAAKKGFKATWKKQTTQTTGYEIQYSTDKKFKKGVKTVRISKNKTTSKSVSKLSAKKKYYVRIRTYKMCGKTKVASSWSGAKSVKTKK